MAATGIRLWPVLVLCIWLFYVVFVENRTTYTFNTSKYTWDDNDDENENDENGGKDPGRKPMTLQEEQQKHYHDFFGHRMCHPGYAAPDCVSRLEPANPWYTADCPNLDQENTMDVGAGRPDLSPIRGVKECKEGDSFGLPLSYCAYLCFSHPDTGTPIVPRYIWEMAQTAEQALWKQVQHFTSNDRSAEHVEGFGKYHVLRNETLGNIIEVGAGPFTQTRQMLEELAGASLFSSVQSFTVYEPAASFYQENMPTSCAYRGDVLHKERGGETYPFPVTVISNPGEFLSTDDPDRPITEYDTLVAINVIEHVENAFDYLEGLYRVIKPGGILVFHERYYDSPEAGDGVLGRNLYHPIRIKQPVLDLFLEKFNPIYFNKEQTSQMIKRNVNENGYYIIAKKKNSQ